MKLHIQPRINLRINYGIFAALILLSVSVLRIPVAEGYFRHLFQLIMETGVLLGFAVWLCSINKWVGLFLILVLFSCLYPNFGKWSYMARNTVVIGLIWYALVVTVRLDIKHLLNAICVIAILNVLFANFQYCGLDPYRIFTLGLMKSTTTQPTGLMANKNILSGLLAMSLPCFFRQQWKWFVPFIFYGLTIASSLGGAIPVVVMVLVYFVLKDGREGIKNNFFKVSALSIWFLFFATYIDHPIEVELSNGKTNLTTQSSIALPGSTNIRTEAWEKGLRLYAHNHPIFGYGIGHWKLAFLKMATPGKPIMTKAHNEFIQGLFEMGVIFPILVLGYLWNVFKRYRKEALIPATALGIIAINSSVNFQFHIATTAIIAVTLMAILEIQLKGGYESA